ncbi:MAG: hypothetical protein LQ346_003456 [Caloplaca aetnensis]|nr:MAG: hypothetical protein LQ346_003456 [Caloplaca aetnensis]
MNPGNAVARRRNPRAGKLLQKGEQSQIKTREEYVAQRRARLEAQRLAEEARRNPPNSTNISTGNIIAPEASTTLTRRASGDMASALAAANQTPTRRPRERRPTSAVGEENILDSADAPRMTRRGSRQYVAVTPAPSIQPRRTSNPVNKRMEHVRGPKYSSSEDSSLPAGRRSVAGPKVPASEVMQTTTTPCSSPPEATQPLMPVESISPTLVVHAEDEPSASQDYAWYEEAEAAVNNSDDPIYTVIQRLATRAESDQNLRELMRAIAAGNTSSAQRVEFQVYMMETEALSEFTNSSGEVDTSVKDAQFESGSPGPESDKENAGPAAPTQVVDTDVPTMRRPSQPRRTLGLLPVGSEDGEGQES